MKGRTRAGPASQARPRPQRIDKGRGGRRRRRREAHVVLDQGAAGRRLRWVTAPDLARDEQAVEGRRTAAGRREEGARGRACTRDGDREGDCQRSRPLACRTATPCRWCGREEDGDPVRRGTERPAGRGGRTGARRVGAITYDPASAARHWAGQRPGIARLRRSARAGPREASASALSSAAGRGSASPGQRREGRREEAPAIATGPKVRRDLPAPGVPVLLAHAYVRRGAPGRRARAGR